MRDLKDRWNRLHRGEPSPACAPGLQGIPRRWFARQSAGGGPVGSSRRVGNRCRTVVKVVICLVALCSCAVWGRGTFEDFGAREYPQLETRQAIGGGNYFQIGHLIHKLIYGGARARGFPFHRTEEEAVEQDIATLMKEFGAEESIVPASFVREVHRYIKQYQDRDRALISQVLVRERARLDQVRRILRRDHLPEDLAYMILVESRFLASATSQEGAAGFWQFTESTAREYGMEVNDQVDERLDLSKSTEAASRYIRDLILDFGTGSSVMLAIAAYNSGAETIHRAVRSAKDPIRQGNFWHWYDSRALPAETRAYVPKVIATILVARNPQQFGF